MKKNKYSAAINYLLFYRNRLKELALSSFKWVNTPKTIDTRFLEMTLYNNGNAVFFYDDVLGYLALPCAMNTGFNIYGIPTNRQAYAVNGYNKKLDQNDSVLIFNNLMHTNTVMDIENYARKLAAIDATIDINLNAQKTPILIICDESEQLTLENLYLQYTGNSPVIKGTKGLKQDCFTVLKTDAPYLLDKLRAEKTQLWNEVLTYLGISNISINKKERLIVDEVMRDSGGTIASRQSRLEARKQACQEINAMFNLNIDVQYLEDNM